jgi:hypothetical protein
MQRLIRILIFFLLTASVWLVASMRSFFVALERSTVTLPATLDRAVAREAEATREMLSRLVTERGNALDAQLTGLRRDVRQMETDIARRAEGQLNLIRRDLNAQLSQLSGTVTNQTAAVTASAANVLQQYGELSIPLNKTLKQVSETADLALDCDHNPDCVYNRYVGTMRGVEKTAVAVAKMADSVQQVTPETARAVQHTSRDMAIIVNRFARPTHWVKSVIFTAARSAGKWFGF